MSHAIAYFPKLSDTDSYTNLPVICPVVTLKDISRRVDNEDLSQGSNKREALLCLLTQITGLDQQISPYAFRIGGRNWLLAKGTD